MKKAVIGVVMVALFLTAAAAIRADQLDDITKQLEDVKNTFNQISSANQTNQAQLTALQKQLNSIKGQINQLTVEIDRKQKEVESGEKVLTYQKTLLNERAKSYYKSIGKQSISVMQLLFSDNLSASLDNFFYQKKIVDDDKQSIIKIVLYIRGIEDKKKELENEASRLAALKVEVDKQSTFLAGEVEKANAYLGELQSKIAQLTTQQQQLIAQKQASLHIPTSANAPGRCDSDLTNGRDPGFGPKFAFFTFGVPNRVGLNQYGAKGRAERGDDYEAILRAYYNFDNFQDFDNITINVNDSNGYNQGNIIWSGSLEDYVKRIYEMPGDWDIKALRAQAIAARSFVLAATNNGQSSICANEYCQAFQTNEKGGKWNDAVSDTAKKVMVKGGSPIKAWFSSTHGGYVFSSGEIGWSSTDWTKHANDFSGSVNSFDDLKNNAYDKDSPWFYCDWGSRSQYNKTAWLKPEELADIVNVILLARKDSGTINHLYQPDQPNPAGTDTWDAGRVRQELGGGAYSTIDSVSVSADFGYGRSTSVNISGSGHSDSISADEFKNFFNLRAPANVQIVGPLYNVEKR